MIMILIYRYLLIFIFPGWNETLNVISTHEVWMVRSSSSLLVHGATNINEFTCSVTSYGRTDTLIYHTNQYKQNKYKVNSVLNVPVSQFDCQNRIMTKDLQKTMKMEKYPHVVIDIRYLSDLPTSAQKVIEGHVDIMIAGVKKHFIIPFVPTKKQNIIQLKGKKQVRFSDFNLIPPSKLGGSIRVKNELDVEVTLILSK